MELLDKVLPMTISYTGDVGSTRSWNFLRLIFRWRGSIWKSVLIELSIWLMLYYTVMFIYRAVLDARGRKTFVYLAHYTGSTAEYIPLTFMLGFFVKIVVDRWKDMFANIGFIDSVAHFVSTIIRGNDEETVIARRNVMRYLCLIQVLVLRDISIKVRKQYPDMKSVIDAGFIHRHEMAMLETIKQSEQFGKYWIPHNWVCQLCYRMREKGRIASDPLLGHLLQEITTFRERLQNLINFDLVPIPLAYPQVVFVAVRTYFLICLFSRQNILMDTSNAETGRLHSLAIELFFPFMTVLQFIFYVGWTKVAEALLNPLGDDDDDFETLFVIERNLAIAMLLADQCHDQVPEQQRDTLDLPTESARRSAEAVIHALVGSAARAMAARKEDAENESENPKVKSLFNRSLKERVRRSKSAKDAGQMRSLTLNVEDMSEYKEDRVGNSQP